MATSSCHCQKIDVNLDSLGITVNQYEFQPEGFYELEFDQANELVRGRQRYFRKEKSASHILNQLLARKGYLQQRSSNELSDVWTAVVAKRWQDKTKVGTIKRGVLEILV